MGDPAGVIEEDEDTFGLDDQDKSITGQKVQSIVITEDENVIFVQTKDELVPSKPVYKIFKYKWAVSNDINN